MPPLGLIIHGDSLLSVNPPVVFCVVVGCLDFKDGCFPVGKRDKIIDVGKHVGVKRMVVHPLILINRISRFLMEYFRHQVFQQVPDLKCYPIVGIVLIRHDIQFVIVQVPCGGKRGYA